MLTLHKPARPWKNPTTKAGHLPALKSVEVVSLLHHQGVPSTRLHSPMGLEIPGEGAVSGLQTGSHTVGADTASPSDRRPKGKVVLLLQITSLPRNRSKRNGYH